uniref:DUF1592 domain-containing protein n=1 Tax=Roseihalotalea indica TaxID=2867963 RepID=A0AA49GKF6_9BACT|nr:DUF1592 domain-containing protein [Tunicatimonas sp. TK19036]
MSLFFRLTCILLFCNLPALLAQEPPLSFEEQIRPVLDQHCFSCHNVGKVAGGINLEKYENAGHLVDDGEIWLKVVKQVQAGQMPPDNKPSLTPEEKTILVDGINDILISSLKENNPGRVVIRRLSHSEYHYTILDLTGIHFDATHFFPADGSGGRGFDNYAGTLFFTPLKMERYYEAASQIVDSLYTQPTLWQKLVPDTYRQSWWASLTQWFAQLFSNDVDPLDAPTQVAERSIFPFASRAYRRFLTADEKEQFRTLFRKIYEQASGSDAFDQAMLATFKSVLVSPFFLYKVEDEQPTDAPYALSGFELATRLSYYLWASLPDEQLFTIAYQENLHDSLVLRQQVERMLKDPKAKRFSESFSTQWFGISELKDQSPVDPERFPEFTPTLRQAMYQETVEVFHHTLTQSRNFLDLLDSDYTYLNEELAQHYGVPGVKGPDMRYVALEDRNRGGVVSMGSVLTATSLPLRTSPVLRGKWVLEEIMGTPPPPPPPDAGVLPEEEAARPDASLRKLLAVHRDKPECFSCHQKMDPIGLGLENYDALGRWRTHYGEEPIVVWDTLSSGEVFQSPAELKQILLSKQENFARTLAEKMFTYAIGRNIEFVDEPTMQKLTNNLLTNGFDPQEFMMELVYSYPFRYRINDFRPKLKSS